MSNHQSSSQNQLSDTNPLKSPSNWTFSPTFQAIYGTPTPTYGSFYRLVTTAFDHRILPKYKGFDILLRTQSAYFAFCKQVDHIVKLSNLAPVSRDETEASWAWTALYLYEKAGRKDMEELTWVFSMRFHPRDRLEKYWDDTVRMRIRICRIR
ncbi:hypothetical protein IFR04_000584 [Cadophora malorum]|uniref:Uncharacterized protein n=1 Tax=Cadophora malorum TaxID=108018 RepID=A0A8H7WK55_9HELO|nr:hypothetical protein IFR04_000584 [Cadophora malorum]